MSAAAAWVLPGVGTLSALDGRLGIPGEKPSPWLTVKEAAKRARCGIKLIYREVKAERLQATQLGGRRELRFQANWIDDWLLSHRVIK